MVVAQAAGRSTLAAFAAAGAVWAAFLLPPQLLAWDGPRAPDWARSLQSAAPYDGFRAVAATVGVDDDYTLFGALIALSFLLIGIPLIVLGRTTGRWVSAVGWLTVAGAPVTVLSYAAPSLPDPWDAFWGAELLLLLVVGVVALVAGTYSGVTRRAPVVWCLLLGATVVVLVASALLLRYAPHGSLVGMGAEVVALTLAAPRDRRRRPSPVVAAVPG